MSALGKELINALNDAKKVGLTTLKASPDVANLRKKLKMSQHTFAIIYHISPETIKKWEQGKRIPDTISRAYLKCIQKAPKTIRELVNS